MQSPAMPSEAAQPREGRLTQSKWPRAALAALLVLHAALMAASALWNSVTFDEYAHLPAGVAYWWYGWRGFAIHNLSPPFLRLWAAGPVVMFGGAEAPAIEPFLAQGPRD